MTSNGNTAQKHLIEILTKTHPDAKNAYIQAIQTAPNKEAGETIKRIYTKLCTYTTKEYGQILTILQLKNEIEELKRQLERNNNFIKILSKQYQDTAYELERWKHGNPLAI